MGGVCCKEEEIDFNEEVELNHFNLLRSVGKGAFGKVRVVQHRGTNQIYALKYINKAKCIKMRAVENIIQERRLLEEIHSPFVCNLRYAFQDDENLFMVIDLMLGGDLRFHLDRMGIMTEDMVRFYAAEISCGLAHLHSKKIVHRDLKPDNVLLDEKGHAHLTDFNIAVHFREEKPLTAVAGSMAYMAPEILSKKGYFASVDWWSLGVVLYELAFGKRPFRAKTNEALTHSILHDELVFPEQAYTVVSADCIDCIRQLITRDLTKRLGCKDAGGIDRFRAHPFFRGVDWNAIESKEAQPPFTPDSKRANFDATHELEELLLEDNPLKVKPRKKKKEGEEDKPKEGEDPAVTKEMRILEEKFTVFDYTKPANGGGRQPSSTTHMDPSTATGGHMQMSMVPQGRYRRDESSLHRDVMEGRDDMVNMTGIQSVDTTADFGMNPGQGRPSDSRRM
ncbi:kinase-like domain-containing protein [Cladochytrium replicatum]|nr:kinase-like domain-containing protein [Cladochytrium replicatum]